MADSLILSSQPRIKGGSREAQRLRKHGQIPAVIYGHKETPESITIPYDEVVGALRHHTRTLEVQAGDKKQSVLIQEIQYDHLGKEVLHIDFLRVSATDKIHVTVPVELRGVAIGIKGGGVLIQPLHNLHVECLVAARPESIRVKIDDLQLGQAIHIRELQVPEGVKLLHDPEAVVVQIKAPTAQADVVAGLPGEGATAEPEVITKKKEKEETEE